MDPITKAAATVAALSPYLIEAAKGAGGKAGEATFMGCSKLFKFLKDKLNGQDEQKALSRLAQEPEDLDNQAALRVVLKESLKRDLDLQNELNALLKTIPKAEASQSRSVVGDSNIVNQAADQDIDITVGERR